MGGLRRETLFFRDWHLRNARRRLVKGNQRTHSDSTMFLRRRSCVFFSRSYAAKVISHEQSSIFANVWQFRSSAAALFGKSRNNWAIKRRRKIGCSPKRFLSVSSFPQSIPDPHFCVYGLPFFSSRLGISQVLLVSLTRSALLGWDPDKSAAVSFRT